jgi:hypothetical protein
VIGEPVGIELEDTDTEIPEVPEENLLDDTDTEGVAENTGEAEAYSLAAELDNADGDSELD